MTRAKISHKLGPQPRKAEQRSKKSIARSSPTLAGSDIAEPPVGHPSELLTSDDVSGETSNKKRPQRQRGKVREEKGKRRQAKGGAPLVLTLADEKLAASTDVTVQTVRARLRREIIKSGISLHELAEKMGYADSGGASAVSRLINLQREVDPRLSTVLACMEALGNSYSKYFESKS